MKIEVLRLGKLLNLFERGARLAHVCENELDEVEQEAIGGVFDAQAIIWNNVF